MTIWSFVPFFGRMELQGYCRLALAFSIMVTEPIFRTLFAIFPLKKTVDILQQTVNKFYSIQPEPSDIPAKQEECFVTRNMTTESFVQYWEYPIETHYATTRDDYLICLHRIPGPRNFGKRMELKEQCPVVLFWHGFLMSSEVWVCRPHHTQNLPFVLAEAGYDVWLGNTRGNKYSCKHKTLSVNDKKFWDFSLDHLAEFDLPDSVEYILNLTGEPSLSYIAFSQGTAMGFAALSRNQDLNQKINSFIALGPILKPHRLESKMVNTLIHSTPEVVYLLFGNKAMLTMTSLWQSLLTPNGFVSVLDAAMWFLFDWSCDNLPHKKIIYRHLYSPSSVKMVVHWFQIITNQRFQMYDEAPSVFAGENINRVVPHYPTQQIKTPLAIFWGGRDTLADMDYLYKHASEPVFSLQIEEYEHLHLIWGNAIEKAVFPAILGLLAKYRTIERAKTVFSITPKDMDHLLQLGTPERDNQQKPVYSGSLSIKRFIKD